MLDEWFGLVRSLVVYRRPGRQKALRRFYAEFVGPGTLVFDVGAHLGDRTAAFAGLGARVIALEPQPRVARWLRRLVGRRSDVVILEEAVGPREGTAHLAVSPRTPTVSTLSKRWREAMPDRNEGFRDVRWDAGIEVPVTTLDTLIDRYGVPDFCKLDIEGYEAEALAGLTHPVEALSVEFVRGGLDVAEACVRRLAEIGPYRFNAVAGEERHFRFDRWRSAQEALSWLEDGAEDLPFGDLYARLTPPSQTES
ncbi:MAG: FkbM family methyltransferase [Gemmatimonadota bacterium]